MIKITKDTKIGDILGNDVEIPGGYNLSHTDNSELNAIIIYYTNKKKTFEDYANMFLKVEHMDMPFNPTFKPAPIEWSFEKRVGLLKFICQDIHVSWIKLLNNHGDGKATNKLFPKEFIDSIINDKP